MKKDKRIKIGIDRPISHKLAENDSVLFARLPEIKLTHVQTEVLDYCGQDHTYHLGRQGVRRVKESRTFVDVDY